MKDEFSLEARFYDEVWGQNDYDADVRFLDELLRKNHCRSLIDIGCGTGNHALKLSKMGYEVTGIDISPSMLERARQKDAKARVKFIQGDMKKLSEVVLDGRFDAAISLGIVSSHLITNEDTLVFLKQLRKILRKDGLFIFDARNAKRINEDYLNKLLVRHTAIENDLQLLLLNYNTRQAQNRNVIIWKPIYLINEKGKVDFQMREHKLRWFQALTLRKLLSESGFKVTGQYSGSSMEELDEEKHVNMWFVAVAD